MNLFLIMRCQLQTTAVMHGIAFIGSELVCKSHQGMPEPITADDFRWLDLEVGSKHFLGHYASRPCFALRVKGQVPEGFVAVGLRGLLGRTAQSLFYLAGRALQIVEWSENHQFCGRCGSQLKIIRVIEPKSVVVLSVPETVAEHYRAHHPR